MKRQTLLGVMLLVVTLILSLSGSLAQAAISDLSYAEGGPSTEDPGRQAPLAFYVDAQLGNDNNPGTKEAPWKTLRRVKVHMENNPPAGTHYLLRRGRTWSESMAISGVHGTPDARIVLGAYGSLEESRPLIRGSIVFEHGSSYLMIRDLEVAGVRSTDGTLVTSGHIFFARDAHNGIIYNNIVHGANSNAIGVYRNGHHMVFARNFVYDVRSNDGFSVHPQNWGEDQGDVGSHHWIIDNVVIGNQGMEEPIDAASWGAEDIKVVGNRLQPVSIFGQGSANIGLAMGHGNSFYWLVGNTIAGTSKNVSIKMGTDAGYEPEENSKAQVSGNVIYGGSAAMNINTKHVYLSHNTFINTNGIRLHEYTEEVRLVDNVFTSPTATVLQVTPPVPTAIAQMDNNVYHCASLGQIGCSARLNGSTLDTWRQQYSFYGFDERSSTLAPAGLSQPGSSWSDPRQWNDPAYWRHFIPAETWAANSGADTPGAFDKDGNRLGLEILPMSGLNLNDGYGWEGTPLVREILAELGVSFMPAGEKRPLLFDDRLRPTITWAAPQLLRPEKVPIDLQLTLPAGAQLEMVRVEVLGGEVIYEGAALPKGVTLDTTEYAAGKYEIGVTAVTSGYGTSRTTRQVFPLEVPAVVALGGISSAFVRGQLELTVDLRIPERFVLKEFRVTLDEQTVFAGASVPERIAVNTLQFADGTRQLVGTAVVTSGSEVREFSTAQNVVLSNWWETLDELEPPKRDWFGNAVDQLKVQQRSAGWVNETSDAAKYFGDASRLRTAGVASEYLVWSTPALRQYTILAFVPQPQAAGNLSIAISADGTTWQELSPSMVLETSGATTRVDWSGEVPADLGAAWLRVTVSGDDQLQLGRVVLRGLR